MSNTLPDILLYWTRTLRVPVEYLADWAECDAKTMYAYLSGARDCPYTRLRRMARQIALLYGDTQVARSLLTSEFCVSRRAEATANGRIDDEMTEMVEALGRCVSAHTTGDRSGMTRRIDEAERVLSRLKAERDRL